MSNKRENEHLKVFLKGWSLTSSNRNRNSRDGAARSVFQQVLEVTLLAQQVSPGCALESGVPDEHSTCRDLGDLVTFILPAATALVLGSWITKGKSLEWLRSIALEGGREVSTLQVKNKSSLVCEKSWTCTSWTQELAYRESVRSLESVPGLWDSHPALTDRQYILRRVSASTGLIKFHNNKGTTLGFEKAVSEERWDDAYSKLAIGVSQWKFKNFTVCLFKRLSF